jgi:hypothetical protein
MAASSARHFENLPIGKILKAHCERSLQNVVRNTRENYRCSPSGAIGQKGLFRERKPEDEALTFRG